MEFTNDDVDTLQSAVNELNNFINLANDEIKKTITSQSESEPDYHDYQSIYDLALLARRMKRHLDKR